MKGSSRSGRNRTRKIRVRTRSADDRAAALLGELAELRAAQVPGWRPMPYHQVLAKWDAEFFAAYNRWYEQCVVKLRTTGIDAATRELIILAVAATVRDGMAVAVHSRRARKAGLPVEHVLDAIAVTGLVAGLPAMRDALKIISEEYRYGVNDEAVKSGGA